MSKFCMQCGKEINDTDMHCQFCGASQENNFGASSNIKIKHKTDILVPIVAVISVILVIVIVVVNLTVLNNGYKKPIDNLVASINKMEYDYLEDALPEFVIDSDKYDSEKNEKQFEDSSKLSKYDNDMELSYDVLDKKAIDDDKLKKLESEINETYDESVDVEQGYDVKIELKVSLEDKEDSQKMTIPVYEIDGKWCILLDSLFGFKDLFA